MDCASVALAFDLKTWNHVDWEVAMAAMEKIDWSDCPVVEVKPGVQSGTPVLRGTRMPVDAIVDNFDYGLPAISRLIITGLPSLLRSSSLPSLQ